MVTIRKNSRQFAEAIQAAKGVKRFSRSEGFEGVEITGEISCNSLKLGKLGLDANGTYHLRVDSNLWYEWGGEAAQVIEAEAEVCQDTAQDEPSQDETDFAAQLAQNAATLPTSRAKAKRAKARAAAVVTAEPEHEAQTADPAPQVAEDAEATDEAPPPVAEVAPASPVECKAARTSVRAARIEAAGRGEMPTPPDFTANTHKPYRKKLAALVALADAGDVDGLRGFAINPISSSRRAMSRFRDLAITALDARSVGL